MCREPATHKVGEEFFFDDPNVHMGHNMTAYICCWHFGLLMKTVCQAPAAMSGQAGGGEVERIKTFIDITERIEREWNDGSITSDGMAFLMNWLIQEADDARTALAAPAEGTE